MDGLRVNPNNITNTLESHVRFATVYDSAILLLCLVGLILNVGLLVIIYIRKQIRRSIYTTYMIQIAVTDAVVCIIWLTLVALQLANLPSMNELNDYIKEVSDQQILADSEFEKEAELTKETNGIFLEQRMFYAMYNFHFYNNIFLLAVMSVERCVAVMKSLRCQRYQFNKKFIYAASGAMWLLAFLLALPTFINPDLIVRHEIDFEGSSSSTSNFNGSDVSRLPVTFAIYECHKPLLQAKAENSSFVRDCCGVTIEGCIDLFISYEDRFNYDITDSILDSNDTDLGLIELGDDSSDQGYEYLDYEYPSHSEPFIDDYALSHNASNYELLYLITLDKIKIEVNTGDVDTCDPMLQRDGQIYQVLANLIIGFFIPFLAIMVSNLLIACIIRGRAMSRLESDNVEEESLAGRRMSDFLRQFSHHGFSRSEGESYKKGSLVSNDKSHKPNHVCSRSFNQNANGVGAESQFKTKSTAIKFHPASPSRSPEAMPIVKTREPRVRLSSLSTQFRRTSGGSGSSAESFLTDMTSLHTSSSPGIRLSAPLFVQTQDGRTLIQRACSADNSGSSGSSSQPASVRRWSSEVFRSSANADEGKKLLPSDENKSKEDKSAKEIDEDKFVSTMPPRDRSESKQGLLESHGRIYVPKQPTHNRAQSYQQSGRIRAYSGASRTSAGGGAGTSNSLPRQTIVYKHAVKQMKVSRTVLIYVIVFAICWIPQRIVHFVYVTEGLIGKGGHFCNILTSIVRLISFFSVLLNPIVYAVTQKELRHFLRRSFNRIYRFRKNIPKTKKTARPHDESNGNPSASVMNHLSTDEQSRMERHVRNRERWFRMVHRLGPRSAWHSITASGVSTYNKPSDGTIDEEREDEKDKSSKGQSSSNSFKGQISKGQSSSTSFKLNNLASGWEDWQQLIDMAEPISRPQINGTAEARL